MSAANDRTTTGMKPSRRRSFIGSLERRASILQKRIQEPGFRGDPGPQQRELAAIKWAVRLAKACEAEQLFADLERGYDV